ncbi:MAG: two-component sensor histidine kinase [Sphingomonas sp.]|jgi:two-component system heavy metal sensor histidine kinase CusS|uniref:Sensor protein n=1 Tax=Variovorax paradoxus TaxID=34073 RepID=A0A2W5QMM8_VARPD|nr:heavy metal sensor histidine kinase [Sphingomonas sp.]MBN8750609.1 heavy metal sensor histidine kinase [Variovorax sp.]PZQ76095.1 MAG: two-component sensor histidine kinase [Variovorax paradoxus]PZU73933.1 MAG: two-component sensor histidine kinase [Sphingomonas sp.]
MSIASIQSSLSRWFAVQTLIGLSLICAGVYAATFWSFQLKHQEEFVRHADIVEHVVRETVQPLNLNALRHKLDDYFQSHSDAGISLRVGNQSLYVTGARPTGRNWELRTSTLAELQLEGKPIELDMSLDIGSDNILLMRLAWTLTGSAALGTAVISLTGALLVRRGLRPLKRLAQETGAAGPDHPGHRIEPNGYARELQPWIAQFNGLLGRVEAAYAQLEAFNADVAHELRTPLSNLIAQAEIELGRDRTLEELKNVLESQLEEARRLTTIVTDMLFLSKADRGAQARRGQPVSLAAQVMAVAEFQEAALEDAHLKVEISGERVLSMDTGLVRRAVSNLVSNATRYATRGSVVRVTIDSQGDQIRLVVQNVGPDIPSEAIPRLFERFYRAEPSRAGSATHHGLGLAIVAAIARMHGGRTFAESREGVTRIGLTLRASAGPGNS